MKSYGSANIKIALLITGIIIIISTLVYTQILVAEILEREREIANLYAKSIEFIANDESQSGEYSFIFNTVVNSNSINFPIVVTDAKSKKPTFTKNMEIDTTLPQGEQTLLIQEMIAKMDEVNPPIKVSYQDSIILSYVHYGQSKLVTRLKTLPIIQFFVAGVFIFLGYFGFNYIKRTEQSNIWVGLSKETAHQLGTPLSSLMGWNELIKANSGNSEKVLQLAGEMSNDVDRLSKIANRFSKIGSKPDLKPQNIHNLIEKVVKYFEIRIPKISSGTFEGNSKKKIELKITGSDTAETPLNSELFEWVLENLTKNALDAIENISGKITFDIHQKGRYIFIDVIDTGKGIDLRFKKDIFRPGYSTKQRGWGLGLSLSKRIIETYHRGKLFVKESDPNRGTTFRIRLNKNHKY
ncbi:MAG: HAMP domain-containing histidine kinase [Chlorobi bacterium]|nr:HAMP domain-containing histidine kinase [Chlorobiota bacterium]MCI0716502.1 HAMP domain-containing histidine kinase [Chlorobiota bacterium]